MRSPQFLDTDDRPTIELQGYIGEVAKSLNGNPLTAEAPRLLRGVSLSAGANTIAHGLGRKPVYMILLSSSALTYTSFDADAGTTTSRSAVFNSSVGVVANILVG